MSRAFQCLSMPPVPRSKSQLASIRQLEDEVSIRLQYELCPLTRSIPIAALRILHLFHHRQEYLQKSTPHSTMPDKFRLPSVLIGPPPGPDSSTCFGASNFNSVSPAAQIIAAPDPQRTGHLAHGATIPATSPPSLSRLHLAMLLRTRIMHMRPFPICSSNLRSPCQENNPTHSQWCAWLPLELYAALHYHAVSLV